MSYTVTEITRFCNFTLLKRAEIYRYADCRHEQKLNKNQALVSDIVKDLMSLSSFGVYVMSSLYSTSPESVYCVTIFGHSEL